MMALAVARDGDNIQQSHESQAGPFGFDFVQGLEEMAQTVGQRAVQLLGAKSVPGGQYPVVPTGGWRACSSTRRSATSPRPILFMRTQRRGEMMVLGRRFGGIFLTVFEDGSIPGLRGTHKYDDEGHAQPGATI